MHYGIKMLRDIILIQKRELENRLEELYIPRKVSKPPNLRNDLIQVITGPRRSGKSFYAVHLLRQTGSFGYVNFDDERLATIDDYDQIVSAVNEIYANPRHLLLDEIQNLPRWELFVNRLQRQGFRILITGSNANLLSSELATHLTGRHTVIVLFPFSFEEYLATSSVERTAAEKASALEIYAEQGGYPEPLLKDIDRRDYLHTLIQSILYKDIIRRFRIRSVQGMDDLSLYLMSNIARETSFNTLSKMTHCKSVHTVAKYINHLQEVFLFFPLKRFSYKVKKQVSHNKKIYCTDNGMAVSAGFRFSADRGALYENLVAVALRKREIDGAISIFYWKNQQNEEVDFVVKEGLQITSLIQVCPDISNPKTVKREMRSLIKASQELNCKELLLLNPQEDRMESFTWRNAKCQIRLVPLWQWLLMQD